MPTSRVTLAEMRRLWEQQREVIHNQLSEIRDLKE